MRDDFSSNRHPALASCLSMIFSENRCTPSGSCSSLTVSEDSAPACCALSPCGRGQRRTFNKHGWVRGSGLTPHPIRSVEPPSSPLPQGERAQQRPPQLAATLSLTVCSGISDAVVLRLNPSCQLERIDPME